MATLKEVATRADVSFSTVSRAINHPDKVKPETRRRVERAIAELNYHPHRAARRLRGHRSYASIFGLIIPDIQNAFYSQIVRGAEEVAYSRGYAVIICNSDESPEREQFYLNVLQQESAAGVILPPITEGGRPFPPPDELPLPVICFDRRPPDGLFDAVVVDNEGGAYQATARLARLGHRRIAAIVGALDLSTSAERRAGYERALREHGLPIEPDLIRWGPPRQEEGHALAEVLLDLPAPPTALFVGNNVMAMGALEAVRQRGLRIADDVAVIAFDDPPWASLITPPLSTVRQPAYEIGRRAAELLLRRIETPERPTELVTLPTTLVVRSSCGRPVAPVSA